MCPPAAAVFTIVPAKKSRAAEIESVWNLKKSEIPNLYEEKVLPKEGGSLIATPHTKQTFCLDFDRIYSGCAAFNVTADVVEKKIPDIFVPDGIEFYRS